MKRILTLLLTAAMLFGAVTGASAVDFQVKGEWLVGFGVGDTAFTSKTKDLVNGKQKTGNDDKFAALQRVRLQLDAVASEALSGTLWFEIGDTKWGQARTGGALGADGVIVEVKNAYVDWAVPQTDLRLRMGLQGVTLPNVAGGSAVFDADVAGIAASYKFSENVGLTALWMRPVNDNYVGRVSNTGARSGQNFLDNIDLFALTLPLTFEGFEITPWAMYGMRGRNALKGYNDDDGWSTADGDLGYGLNPYPTAGNLAGIGSSGKMYSSMFWAGLPIAITALDPWNFELDINYGYSEGIGRYDAIRAFDMIDPKRANTKREGWLAKALIEYKLDWGTPGIFGWYASGDDGDPKNGSERLPTIAPAGNFTRFMGDGDGWAADGLYYDRGMDYAGTWGIGAQLKDVSFIEDLSHTLIVAYWGGTNSPRMARYMGNAYDWNSGSTAGPYLTTRDGLLEINLLNSWKVYENFKIEVELGYIANFMDNGTWNKAGNRDSSFEKQDAWKAQMLFAYTF